jgi:ribosomal-protein-alanine N-acetyltransferase
MRIRYATAADIPNLMALEKHVATAAHWSMKQYETVFSAQPPPRVMLIIENEAGVQGFIVGRTLEKEWEIENIVVAGSVRRCGLGARAVADFLELARDRGADTVFLEVRESNVAARRLYEKLAFMERGRRKLYYQDPAEDAIVYQFTLP